MPEKLTAGIIAQALLDYAAGDLSASWFETQPFVNLNFSRILPLVKYADVQARLKALIES